MTRSITPTLDHASSGMAETLIGDGPPPRPDPGGRLDRGAMLGRYIVLDTLGRGGMGIVYAAYDPDLDRRVALKLLLPGRGGGAAAGLRLQREAQAIARLSHPNVVAVHDVGSLGEQVFIAMELVDGTDLARWLEAEPRTPAARLDCFLQAGAGLAAAHAADLVHRDFKPENVLVGRDGRARVVDFGLVRKEDTGTIARVSLDELESLPKEVSHRFTSHSDDVRLTDAGSLVGTPAYMSPEQFHGLPGDARSDQFSFCVALYEALYGERPFAGENPIELSQAVCQGELRPPPAKHEVSGRLRRVLVRGLSVEPSARYPSMEALLEALRQARASRRRWWVVAAVAIVGVGVGLQAMTATPERPCAHVTDRSALVWNPERRAALGRAFTDSGPSYAADTWARVEGHIDAQVSQWSALQTEVCEANQALDSAVAAEDPRQRCLDERLAELGELLLVLDRVDAKLVTKAVTLAHGMGAVDECATVDVGGVAPSPSDPALRVQVDELRAEIRRMELRASAGLEGRDAKTLDALVERAEALDYGPLLAEIRDLQSSYAAEQGDFDTAVKLAELAFDTALASRHDRHALRIAGGMTFLLGVKRREPTEAHRWARHAEALLARLGNDDAQRMRLVSNWASVYALAGDDEQAQALYDEALALARAVDESSIIGTLLNNIGAFHAERRRPELAQRYLEEAVARQEDLLGPDHPGVLRTRANLGVIAVMQGHYLEGRRILETVLPRQQAALGIDHPEIAVTLEGLATALTRLGELEKAREARERVLEIRLRVHGPHSRPVLSAEANIQNLLISEGRKAEAYERGVQLLAVLEAGENVDPRVRVQVLENLAVSRMDVDPTEALQRANEALELYRSVNGGERDEAGLMLTVGRAHEELGDRKRALASFEEILRRSPSPVEPWVRVRAAFGQARLTHATDPVAALTLARQAIEQARAVVELDRETQKAVHEIEEWLREHP